jgi:diaminopimelate decarboxylase
MTAQLPFPQWNQKFLKSFSKATTPFYFYSESILESLWNNFEQNVLKIVPTLHLHFALKSNNNPEVIKFFKKKKVGLDLVSIFESQLALNYGFKAEDFVFSGVGKSDEELREAITKDFFLINIESESEFLKIKKIAHLTKKKVNLSIRVNPDIDAQTHPYISTGLYEHKFGLDFESALLLYKQAINDPYLNMKGISVHIGSQLLNLDVLKEALWLTLNLAEQIKKMGFKLVYLDVGGGVGVDYSNIQSPPNFEEYGKILKSIDLHWKKIFGKQAHLLSECGRSLCAQAGFIITKIISIKRNQRKNFCIVDASMTELLRPALYQAVHPVVHFQNSKMEKNKNLETFDLVGPVCESSDVLAKGITLPKSLNEGEYLCIQGIVPHG